MQVRLSPLVSQQSPLLPHALVQLEPEQRFPPQLVLPPPLEQEPEPLQYVGSFLVQPLAQDAPTHCVLELALL